METKKKKEYEAPSTQVVEMKSEGILCASGDPFGFNLPSSNPFGGGEDW